MGSCLGRAKFSWAVVGSGHWTTRTGCRRPARTTRACGGDAWKMFSRFGGARPARRQGGFGARSVPHRCSHRARHREDYAVENECCRRRRFAPMIRRTATPPLGGGSTGLRPQPRPRRPAATRTSRDGANRTTAARLQRVASPNARADVPVPCAISGNKWRIWGAGSRDPGASFGTRSGRRPRASPSIATCAAVNQHTCDPGENFHPCFVRTIFTPAPMSSSPP